MIGLLQFVVWSLFVASLFGLIAVVAIDMRKRWKDEKSFKPGFVKGGQTYRFFARLALLVVVVLFAAVTVSGIKQVPAGYRAVEVLWGGDVTGKIYGEGLAYAFPGVSKLEEMNVQVMAHKAVASAASRDLQDVKTTVTLNFSLDPFRVDYVYETFRRDYEVRIIEPGVQEAVKAVTARYNAEELITKREDVKEAIATLIRTRLNEHGMLVDTINITDFTFSESFTAAIEAKVSAAQNVLTAENELRTIEVEARKAETAAVGVANAAIASAEGAKKSAILQAEGVAQSVQIEADGKAKAILTLADAQARANNTVRPTLSELLVKNSMIDQLSPSIQTVILPSGSNFLLPSDFFQK
jgi:regulator of protease activity HflC (stomatin/prohibitin superfamily)